MKAPDESLALCGHRKHRLSFETPAEREEFYNDYPADEQDRVRDLHDLMTRIDAAKNRHRGCRENQSPRWSWQRLQTIHTEWCAAKRDWRVLVDGQKFPDAREPRLPEAFRDFIRSKFSANQRKNAPAYRQIIRQWERWLTTGDARFALPGYEVCPLPGRQARHPRGWSEKNLNRFAPAPAELEMARIGLAAALALLPHIHGTREGVRFLEYVSGDDMFLNRKVCVSGYRDPARVVQFGMMDYGASYYLEGFIQRPVLPRGDGTVEQLKRRDFLWCVALMLERYGYPLDYVMHIICERGTATMTKAEARFLYEVSNGQIIVGWSTMEGEMIAAWDERQSGNSNAKPWHESTHNLLQNEEGDLEGQMGKDRDHAPAALYGRERAAQALSDIEMVLPLAQRPRIIKPFPDLQACYAGTLECVKWIHHAKKHECAEFATVLDWRPRGLAVLPLVEDELPKWIESNPYVRAALLRDPAALDQFVEYFPRPESRHERMLRLSAGAQFARLPSGVYRRFYEDCHETRRIDNRGTFTFQRDKRTYCFEPPSPAEALPPGAEVTGFFRPDESAIHLFTRSGSAEDGVGSYLLTWPSAKHAFTHLRGDVAGKQLDHERKRRFIDATAARVRKDHAPLIEQAAADARHNLAVAAEHGLLGDSATPRGEHALAIVHEACTPAAAGVLAVTEQRTAAARTRAARRTSAASLAELADAALSRAGERLDLDSPTHS